MATPAWPISRSARSILLCGTLKGKALGVPIHQLLGGKVHDKLRACASTHPSKAKLDDLARELAEHVANGYTAVKVGFGKTGEANLGVDFKRDIEYVRTVREMIGRRGFHGGPGQEDALGLRVRRAHVARV